jgi:hypothetical protein
MQLALKLTFRASVSGDFQHDSGLHLLEADCTADGAEKPHEGRDPWRYFSSYLYPDMI